MWVVWSLRWNAFRRRESSLSVVMMGSCVVRGECWPTEVMRVLRIRTKVVG